MPRYSLEIDAGDGFPDLICLDFANHEAGCAYMIELASARLQSQDHSHPSIAVFAVLRDEDEHVLAVLRSGTEST